MQLLPETGNYVTKSLRDEVYLFIRASGAHPATKWIDTKMLGVILNLN